MRAKSSGDNDLILNINTTPFTDVVLVLLIIFMIVAPALDRGMLELDLPSVATEPEPRPDVDGMRMREIVVLGRGRVLIGNETFEVSTLESEALKSPTRASDLPFAGIETDEVIAISADRAAPYEEVVRVLAAVSALSSGGGGRVVLRTVVSGAQDGAGSK
jgi:biopolymer transport protein ExbD